MCSNVHLSCSATTTVSSLKTHAFLLPILLLPCPSAVARRSFAQSLIGGPHEVPLALVTAGRGKAQPGKHGVGE